MAFYDDTLYDESTGPTCDSHAFDFDAILDGLPFAWAEDEPVADDFTIQLARELDVDLFAILAMVEEEDAALTYDDAA